MRISEILQTKGSAVVTVRPDQSVRELVSLLAAHNVGATVVSDDQRDVLGIVSERDVVRGLVDGAEVLDHRVAAIMTPADRVRTCAPNESVDRLAELMTANRIRHVPVLDDDGVLCGLVSIGDVVKSRIGELQLQRDELEHYVTS